MMNNLKVGEKQMSKIFSQGHALLVGVGGNLPNTITDVKAVASILEDAARCAYLPDQAHLLTGKKATRTAVLSELDSLSQTTDSCSTVIVYFSGHGYRKTSSTGKSFYLLTSGYNLNELKNTAISGDEFTARLRTIPARKLLVLLDCCHAGGVGEAKIPELKLNKAPLPLEAMRLFEQGTGRVLIASSREDEVSFAGRPYSVFTLGLIEALSGVGVAKEDGYVRVADLAMHTRETVPARTAGRQHPILHFEQADNFAIAYYAGGDAKPKGVPFSVEPAFEPVPGVWRFSDPEKQTMQVSGAQGPVLSSGVNTQARDIQIQGGFYQPGWKVDGDVTQAQRDLVVNEGIHDDALELLFDNLINLVKSLPMDAQEAITPLIEETYAQARKIQDGDDRSKTKRALERHLRSLIAMAPDIGEVAITTLTNPAAGIAKVIRTIVRKAQDETES
jgi:hypothetical protein